MHQPSITTRVLRALLYCVIFIVFVGPFWGIMVTAFSGQILKPGQLLLGRCSQH